ncbi:MAG: biotin--[acetyl-CoA-carboxylase] ligase [Chloroflexota bacterium]|nr:biotin--[acetyl-CoA-carboxylase] ligase [Chloroflexota bacterium]
MAAAFDLDRFRAALRTDTFGRNLIFEPSVGSTMDVARGAAGQGAPEGTLALADEQTAGRGRLGRSWLAPPAVNLLSTLLLRPPAAVLRQVAMIAPLAVCDAVEECHGLRLDIKWPNDVQAHGKKLAGILIEVPHPPVPSPAGGEGESVVLVGAGINVNFDPRPYEEVRDIATSVAVELAREAGRPVWVEREPLLAAYLAHFERMYAAARAGASVRDAWRARLVTLGREVRAAWPGGSAEGTAEDVDDAGALIVRTAGGERVTVEAGDVTLRGE